MLKRHKKSKYWEQVKIPIVVVVVGLFMNIGGKLVALNLGLPVYLDTSGTILSALLCGYLPSILVAMLTNIIGMLISANSMFYDPINIMIALTTVAITRSGMKRSIKSHTLLVLIYTFFGGILGGLISIALGNTGYSNYNAFIVNYFLDKGMPFSTGWYIANLFFELIDKTLAFCFSLVLFNLVPRELYYKFDLSLWFQEPMSLEEIIAYERQKRFKFNIRHKIVTVIIIFSSFIAFISIMIYMSLFRNYMIDTRTDLAVSASRVAAEMIDGDTVESYLESMTKDEEYYETEQRLLTLLENTSSCRFIYAYKFKSDGCHVIFDLDENTKTTQALGSVVTFDTAFLPYIDDFLNGDETVPVLAKTQFGYFITSYSPVYDSNGKCVCYVAVDIKVDEMVTHLIVFFGKYLSIFFGALVLFISFGIWLSKYSLVYPLDSMTVTLDKFQYKDEYDRQQNVDIFKKINVRTGDEIQGLYENILSLTEENAKYSMENRQKMENIELAKENMAILVSKILEYRNYDGIERVETRKRYVEVTLNKMLELGYYKDILTKSLINDIVICAPFYDIGKIGISEDILSREGSLNEEEQEILNNHTVIGYKLMSEIMENMPDAAFLAEAKNLTLYHHENWDGSGYPKGLKGEEIPLAGRVMAVAIEYDKLIIGHEGEELDLHRAFFYINSQSAKLFDPLVVDAFVKSRNEIIEIAKESIDKV